MIAPDDRSYLYGDGLFETFRVHNGHVRWLPEHLARFERSAKFLGFGATQIEAGLEVLSQAPSWEDGIWRVTVTREHHPNLWGGSASVTRRHRAYKQRGPLHLDLMSGAYLPNDVMLEHKTTSYIRSIMAKRYAVQLGVDDVIRCSHDGWVGETSCANIFVFIEDRWMTPPIKGVLPGVTRAGVLALMARRGIPFSVEPLLVGMLSSASEMFVTSAAVGVCPVATFQSTSLSMSRGEALQEMVAAQ